MEAILGQLINGIKLGGIYSVAVLGYNLLLLTTGIFHIGYASILILSMYSAWLCLTLVSGNFLLGILAAIVSGVVINLIIAPLFMPFIKHHSELESVVVSLALGAIAVEIMAQYLNLGMPIAFPRSLLIENISIRFGLTTIRGGEIVGLVGSILIVFTFFKFLNHTTLGRVLRVVAQDSEVARILGISVPRTAAVSFILSGILAGMAAILLAMSVGTASPSFGDNLMIECLAILFLAGIGNLKGGVICSLIVGIIDGKITR